MDVGKVLVVSVDEGLRSELLANLKKVLGGDIKIEELVEVENLDQALTATILNDVALVVADLESLRLFTKRSEEGIKQELVRTLLKNPTILITRPETLDLLEAALELGARSFLSMPLDLRELKQRLVEHTPSRARTNFAVTDELGLAPDSITPSLPAGIPAPAPSANAQLRPASQAAQPSTGVKPPLVPRRPDENVVGVKGRMVQGVQGHPLL